MKELRSFFRDFFNNGGRSVFYAMVVGKICAFAASVLLIRLLPKTDFGSISIVVSWFSVFAAFCGVGYPSSLLRYGSLRADSEEKDCLASVLFWKAFHPQLLLTVGFISISFFYFHSSRLFLWVFLSFGVRLVGIFLMAHIQNYQRIYGNNKSFAQTSNLVNIGGLILLAGCCFFFGLYGYLVAISLAPFLSLIWLKKVSIDKIFVSIPDFNEIKNYAWWSSFSTLLSDAIFSADILLLGYLAGGVEVAGYRAAILIPSNIAFLALVFIQTDFSKIAANSADRAFLERYVRNYYRIFIPVTIGIFIFSVIFKDIIIKFFFGKDYLFAGKMFVILMFSYCINLLTRNLYGNLLAAVGKIKYNTAISGISVIILVILSLIIVPGENSVGMAYTVATTYLLCGALYAFIFFKYLMAQK